MVRSFAIVPAAGHSVRMGRPKLLLPLGGRPIIEHVLAAWTGSQVTRTVVVVRGDDVELAACCRAFNVDVVTPPEPPREMKASIACAVEHIARRYAPGDADAWLVAPADMPELSSLAIDRVLSAFDPTHPQAVAATHLGQRGHPVLLPWRMARRVHDLAPHEGVSALVARMPTYEVACPDAGILVDLDTPADLEIFARAPASRAAVETSHGAAVL